MYGTKELPVTLTQVDPSSHGAGQNFYTYSAEAAELRWNGFPLTFETTIGNGMPFRAKSIAKNKVEDTDYVDYVQDFGCANIRVYND